MQRFFSYIFALIGLPGNSRPLGPLTNRDYRPASTEVIQCGLLGFTGSHMRLDKTNSVPESQIAAVSKISTNPLNRGDAISCFLVEPFSECAASIK